MEDIKIETVTEVSLKSDVKTDIVKIGIIHEGQMFLEKEIRYQLNSNNTVTVL